MINYKTYKKSLIDNGYQIISEFKDVEYMKKYFVPPGGSWGIWTGPFIIEDNEYHLNTYYDDNKIQKYKNYYCYPFKQVIKNSFKITQFISKKIKSISYGNKFDNEPFSEVYWILDVVHKNNKILECYIDGYFLVKSNIKNEAGDYDIVNVDNAGGVIMSKYESMLLLKDMLMNYNHEILDGPIELENYLSKVKTCNVQNDFSTLKLDFDAHYPTLRFYNDENKYIIVKFSSDWKEYLKVSSIRYINDTEKIKTFIKNMKTNEKIAIDNYNDIKKNLMI